MLEIRRVLFIFLVYYNMVIWKTNLYAVHFIGDSFDISF